MNADINTDNLLYSDVTFKIRAACFEVWNRFGGAFKESIVDKALTIALVKQGLMVEDQVRIDVFFDGKKVGAYIPDKIVNGLILIELKSKPFITEEDKRQFWLYLKGSEYKLGLLVNFGPKRLEIIRRIYDIARKTLPRQSA